jgi:hypothetical protein
VSSYADNVFLNHPLDPGFHPIRDALVFAIHDCGFVARSALEASDASENRLDKIYRIIEDSRFSVHDLSRTEPNDAGLPRFNMPFELGIFLACKRFGGPRHRSKKCLVLERVRFQSKQFLSDLSGADVQSHGNKPTSAITHVRDFLQASSKRRGIPSAKSIRDRYKAFTSDLPSILDDADMDAEDMTFLDLGDFSVEWLRANAR